MGGYKAKLSSWVHTFSAKGQMGFIMLLSLSSGYVILCFVSILVILSNLQIFLWPLRYLQGVSLPLGPLFLGPLYAQLDELHSDETMGKLVLWSLHCCIVPSFRLSYGNFGLNTSLSARSFIMLNVTSRTVLLRLLCIVADSLIRSVFIGPV